MILIWKNYMEQNLNIDFIRQIKMEYYLNFLEIDL